ncbi:hypothetical protein RFI_11409 [Reticulomyxa filosa]|uniref:Uncharacterized protein n=1 Tax=Reticulomyxa filosa TaxID=46433 RepID=X6NIJ2_RETFI|nr:hypothetical protein RFI_11409 [Reticulomyxa filosa]|eukprot:ETO25723.1 hypothetical protein RFI_11409 [Reticulomyxa filosa]
MQQEMGQMKEKYELQLRGVEGILVNNGTEYFAVIYFFSFIQKKKKGSLKKKENVNKPGITNTELEKVKNEMEENLRRYQQQQIEQQRLQKSFEILKLEKASEMQEMLIRTNEQLAKKEDELLRLRWTVQV